jgi:tRNA modification GTPase
MLIILEASVINEKGIEELEDIIYKMFYTGEISQNNEIIITNARHKNLVDMSLESIDQAINSFEIGMPLDMVTIDIKNSADFIGKITGESIDDAIMHEIFSQFCIGK